MSYDDFLSRAANVMKESPIRLMGAVGARVHDLISFAPGYPDPATFPWEEFRTITGELLSGSDGNVLQYGPTRGYRPLVEALDAILSARGIASAFAVVSGHAPSAYEPVLDSIRPGTMTLVLLMAVAAQREIAAALLAREWPAATPAALVFGASRDEEETWTGTLASLVRGEGPRRIDHPGTLIIGDVVHLRAALVATDEASMGHEAAK